MATKHWIGGATAVAQVATGSIDSVDGTPANNTFTVTVGGIAISAVGDTDVATTATNLRASLNASTHPYFAAVTWSGGTGDIIGTADTAGVPFVAALTETGAGTGAVTDFAATTASAGPNDWSTANNWSDVTVPGAADNVYIRHNAHEIVWGLAQSAIDLTNLYVDQTFTGSIGLKSSEFATSVDAATTDATVTEYRQTYLDIGWTRCEIGDHKGPGAPTGSSRLKLDNDKAGASTTIVHNTAAQGEGSRPAVMLLAAHASATLEVRKAPGGVGLAVDVAAETSTFGNIDLTDTTSTSSLYVGEGVTSTNYSQRGGTNKLSAAATVTLIKVDGGTLELLGEDYTVTTLTVGGGTVTDKHQSTGVAVTTLNLNGGEVDASKSELARTYTTLNHEGGTLVSNAALTVTTYNEPQGLAKLTAADV